MKYEYRALHDVPATQVFQNHVGDSTKDFDHLNKYLHCENGAWDKSYMRGLRERSFWHNHKGNESSLALRELSKLSKDDFAEAIKDYNR